MGREFVACYDLAISPPSFDAVSFILHANIVKKSRGFDTMRVLISPGPQDGFRADNSKMWPPRDKRRQMLEEIIVPLFRMAPAEVEILREPLNDKRVWGVDDRKYSVTNLFDARKAGECSLRPAHGDLTKKDRLITITLREATHHPDRNSNVDEWVRAARKLWDRGFEVVVIRDTHMADEPLGVATCTAASYDLDFRVAMYRSALCNLFVNNGPAWLCMGADAPMVVYKMISGGGKWEYSRNFWKHFGIVDQLPGSPSHQRLVWNDNGEENADMILGGFDAWLSLNTVPTTA